MQRQQKQRRPTPTVDEEKVAVEAEVGVEVEAVRAVVEAVEAVVEAVLAKEGAVGVAEAAQAVDCTWTREEMTLHKYEAPWGQCFLLLVGVQGMDHHTHSVGILFSRLLVFVLCTQ